MKIEACVQKKEHQEKYREAREEYQKAEAPGKVCLTADMQKVLVLPKLTTKEHVFVSHLVTFNETFASKTAGIPNYCVLWHEAIAGHKAPDVVSTYLKIIRITCVQDMSKNIFDLGR